MNSLLDSILTYNKSESVSFYKILKVPQSASTEQIITEYRILALELHPDKNPTDSKAVEHFQALLVAKDVLCNEQKRRDYDRWLHCGISMPYDVWTSMKSVQTSMHWANFKTHDPMIEQGKDDGISTTGSTSDTYNVPAGMDSNHPTYWKRDERGDNDLLKKFRNYEI